jgi:uncharacterized repeat protein (TIGR03803 family)
MKLFYKPKTRFAFGLSLFIIFAYLINVQAQTFYGLATQGGTDNMGAIIKYDNATTTLTAPSSVINQIQGSSSGYTELKEYLGKFYGMTPGGGANDEGVIFEWDPNTNIYTKKIDLSNTLGSNPLGSLTLLGGKFYGMTQEGGLGRGTGVIFEWDPSTNVYTKKIEFDGENGSRPFGSLTLFAGKFYGMTSSGGVVSPGGIIFEWDPITNVYTKKVNLGGANGSQPQSDLTLYGDKFYGMTRNDGANGAGVIFEWDPITNVFTKKIDFNNSNGGRPYGRLTLFGGKFYGMTSEGGVSPFASGVIFEWNPVTNVYTKKLHFTSMLGSNPQGSLTLVGDKFYGMTRFGGTNGGGVIFEWEPNTNIYTKKVDFNDVNGSNPAGSLTFLGGKFYGMTPGGGAGGRGVIFEWNPSTNVYTKKIDLSVSLGSYPFGSMALSDNKFYGMTNEGGATNRGVIFEWDPSTNIYAKKIDFNGTNGSNPYGSLTLSGSKFYGMTNQGGNGGGVIFEWNPTTNVYTKKVNLNSTGGINPYGSLTLLDGKFYGMTNRGGANDAGVIFEWNPVTNVYTKKVDFDGINGSNPYGSLTISSGKFYGMTYKGGTNDAGVIFEWNPVTNVYTKKIDLSTTLGSNPYGHLTLLDGKFYGMTSNGGTNSGGVIFEWDPSTSAYTKKMDFDDINGNNPLGSLTLSSGKFYGMTSLGGGSGRGVIFEWTPNTNDYTLKADFNITNGAHPQYGHLVEFEIPAEINLQGNGLDIIDGDTSSTTADHTDFGDVNTGTNYVRTFTIQNTGTATLNISSIGNTNPTDFTVGGLTLPTLVNAGFSTTFTITFNASTVGTKNASITVNSNDANEAAYDFAIRGNAITPIIIVKGNNILITNGSTTPAETNHTNFANWALNTPITRTFTIENTGSASLNITGVTLTGADASDFSITQQPATTVVVGQSTTFTVSHTPTQSAVAKNAIVNIANNSAISPFTFAIRGSDVVLSISSSLSVGKVEFYPNPAKNLITISLEGNTQTEVGVTLFDAQGNPCLSRTLPVEVGKAYLHLKSVQASGLYFLRVQVGKEWIIGKVVVER